MSKEAAVQPTKAEINATEAVAPAVENIETVTFKTKAVLRKAGSPDSAAKEDAAKPKSAKKAADKAPDPALQASAKAVKKAPAAASEEVAETPKATKTTKSKKQVPKKPKLIRDSFTIPEADYTLFAGLKQRALTAGIEVKKSEILRAALTSLAQLDDAAFAKAIVLVERIKTGRPKK